YGQTAPHKPTPPVRKPKAPRISSVTRQIVGIASSTGGPQALQKILTSLPKDFPTPICIVQHISEGFVPGMISWLTPISALPLKIANDGEIAEKGVVYFAPDGKHLLADRHGSKIKIVLDDGPPVNGFRPSGNPLLRSLAQNFGASAVGCILTGMGDDGADGLLELYNSNGHTFVQDEESSIIFGMPGAAVKKGATETCIALDDIASHLINTVYGTLKK
ncbi:MAG: chemotaxis protein CheB, partial [Rhodospirillaceae bacterium]|nr:chemotaxis protein CheB [Rhodospirillaceae bacterium]